MSSPVATPNSLRYLKTPSLKAQSALDRVVELRRAAELRAAESLGHLDQNRLRLVQAHLSSAQRRGEDVRTHTARALMRDVAECPARRNNDSSSSSNSSLSSDDELSEEWSQPTSEDDAEGDFIHHAHPWDPPLVSLDDQQEIADVMAWVGHQRRLSKMSSGAAPGRSPALLPHMTPPLTFTKQGFGLRGLRRRGEGAVQRQAKKACNGGSCGGVKKTAKRKDKLFFRLPPSTASGERYSDDEEEKEQNALAVIRRAGQRVQRHDAELYAAEERASPSSKHSAAKREYFRERAAPLQLLTDARRRDALRSEVHEASVPSDAHRLSVVRRAAADSQHALPKLWMTSP